jgi:hypothetical protein
VKTAVVTPFHEANEPWLERCISSVFEQTARCTQVVVCDGSLPRNTQIPKFVQVIHLLVAHSDFGNTPRAIGSVSAISQGFDAIAYLDCDNWYEPNHIESLNEAHTRTGAAVCSSGRTLYDVDGNRLGACPEVDGENFVDTNCLYLTRKAFGMVTIWYLMARSQTEVGDRCVWNAIKAAGLARFHDCRSSVNCRTRNLAHYRFLG